MPVTRTTEYTVPEPTPQPPADDAAAFETQESPNDTPRPQPVAEPTPPEEPENPGKWCFRCGQAHVRAPKVWPAEFARLAH